MVFDTETTSINKPFCYDVGYLFFDDTDNSIVLRKHFVIEQVWHNTELFASAYYAEKRPLYVTLMRTRQATLEKWGYVMQEMIRDIKKWDVTDAYAYNSTFDDNVFTFNCDWFKTQNPFDNVTIHDVWGFVSEHLTKEDDYKIFCERNALFTDGGNYSGSAESVYKFITNDPDFVEAHMGLYDAEIEAEILQHCVNKYSMDWATDYKVIKVLNRLTPRPYKITVNGKVIHTGEYVKKSVYKDNFKFTELAAGE